jgi:CheY-like chemotaxis protein
MSERLAAIGQLAASVAHEINNPLACVLANQGFLRSGLDELGRKLDLAAGANAGKAAGGPGKERAAAEILDELRQVLTDAAEGAASVRNIVRDMRALARSDDSPTEVDINEAIRSALRVTRAEIRHHAKVTTELGADVEVMGNGGRLSQVFINLLVNAAQAIEEKSGVGGEIVVTSRRKADDVIVDVSDSGPGINPASLARLFEPFFTTKGSTAGTGLGLSISRDIVRRYGGELRAVSTLGQGATFMVTLPAAHPVAVSEAGCVQPEGPVSGIDGSSRTPRPRVLFVEDDVGILRAYERAFRREHEIILAENGVQALAILGSSKEIDAVVCDLLMPEMSGMELYRRIQETDPEVARVFVFVTGSITQKEVQAFLSGVENQVIEKPFDFGELRRAVEGCVSRRRPSPKGGPARRSTREQ